MYPNAIEALNFDCIKGKDEHPHPLNPMSAKRKCKFVQAGETTRSGNK